MKTNDPFSRIHKIVAAGAAFADAVRDFIATVGPSPVLQKALNRYDATVAENPKTEKVTKKMTKAKAVTGVKLSKNGKRLGRPPGAKNKAAKLSLVPPSDVAPVDETVVIAEDDEDFEEPNIPVLTTAPVHRGRPGWLKEPKTEETA